MSNDWPPHFHKNPRCFAVAEMKAGIEEETPDIPRPRTRADCESGPRPCPWVGCRYHLALDMHKGVGFGLRDIPPWEMTVTCALDVASIGGLSLEQTGEFLGLTRQRIEQIEKVAMRKVKTNRRLLTEQED